MAAKRIHYQYTIGELVNSRYDGTRVSFTTAEMHPKEDRNFVVSTNDRAVCFGVMDGHDGEKAVIHATQEFKEFFKSQSWNNIVNGHTIFSQIPEVLEEVFLSTDKRFFDKRNAEILEKKALQNRVDGLRSFEALQRFPIEVMRLQELDKLIQGGTTAVVAVMYGNKLYAANVGDSRAVLFFNNGSYANLSVDHSTDNPIELDRLARLNLNPQELKKNKRLGSQENTRSIGDYNLKEGYKDVDVLNAATGPPGTAEPYLFEGVTFDPTWRYLVLMTDGVYKTLAATLDTDSNNLDLIYHQLLSVIKKCDGEGRNLAGEVINRIARMHIYTYLDGINARDEWRRTLSASCAKRDDMTLIIVKFLV